MAHFKKNKILFHFEFRLDKDKLKDYAQLDQRYEVIQLSLNKMYPIK